MNRRFSASAAVIWSMCWFEVVKKLDVPTLTYGYELWVMNKRMRSWIHAAIMNVLLRVARCSLRDKVSDLGRSSEQSCCFFTLREASWGGSGIGFGKLPGCLPGKLFTGNTGRRPRRRPKICCLLAGSEHLGIPLEELEMVSGGREV